MRQVQNYDIENLTKRSLKTDLILDADVFLKKSKTCDNYRTELWYWKSY